MAKKKKRRSGQPPKPKEKAFKNQALAGLVRLKDQLQDSKDRKPQQAPPPRKPPTTVDAGDSQLFSQAMADVQPLEGRPRQEPSRSPAQPRKEPVAREEEQEVMRALQNLVEGQSGFSIHVTDEAIEGAAEGMDRRILRRLRQGEYAVQDHLDLHGLTRTEAREEVNRFLLDASHRGLRCVLVVHGRGHGSKDKIPVLKNALKTWFTRRGTRKMVLAFTSARPCDGGAGAVYVLLRKKKPLT